MITSDDRTNLIWDWCRDAYLRLANKRLSFPKNTDITKTYQWRYLKALERKFVEWEFNDVLCKAFIDVAIINAKKLKLFDKGLSIFLMKDLLSKCYNELTEKAHRNNDVITIISHPKKWLVNELENSNF